MDAVPVPLTELLGESVCLRREDLLPLNRTRVLLHNDDVCIPAI